MNQMPVNKKALKYEKYFLTNADLILPVSKRYSEMIQEKYPICVGRTSYLHNGVLLDGNLWEVSDLCN